jgi:hypothetical protein
MYKPTPGPHKRTHISTAPRPHERRAGGQYPYYRVGKWNETSLTFIDRKKPYETLAAAEADCAGSGTYRITIIEADQACRTLKTITK